MTIERIEAIVEQITNQIDALFMNRRLTQKQYDRKLEALARWADRQYRWVA